MRPIAIALFAASALLAAPAALAAKPRPTPQQQLDKLLEGREAQKPVSCISSFDARDLQVIDGIGLVYGRGHVIYVNLPHNATRVDDDDVLVTRSFTSQLCSLDIVQSYDRGGHFWNGFVNLGEFVPYKRVAKAH